MFGYWLLTVTRYGAAPLYWLIYIVVNTAVHEPVGLNVPVAAPAPACILTLKYDDGGNTRAFCAIFVVLATKAPNSVAARLYVESTVVVAVAVAPLPRVTTEVEVVLTVN